MLLHVDTSNLPVSSQAHLPPRFLLRCSSPFADTMRASVAPWVLACYVFAQCAAVVWGSNCFNPAHGHIADGSFSCALQFFATGMEGKSVSLKIVNPLQGDMVTADTPFDHEKAVVEFIAPIHNTLPACLHLEKIEVTFKAPYNIDSIDKLILNSFEGEKPATQEPLGECFTIEQHEVHPGGWGPPRTVSSVYGTVYTDLWCVPRSSRDGHNLSAPQQLAFEQLSDLKSGC